jgi:transcriptional regulator with XRE-family HTH domain
MGQKPTAKQLMKAAKITQKTLATTLGISQAAVSQILNPESDPKLSTLRKLSRALGTDVGTLAATYIDPDDDCITGGNEDK